MGTKIFKPLLLGLCCFLLGYAAANYITPDDLRGIISPQTESASVTSQSENASASPREKRLLTLQIERATESAPEIAAENTVKEQDAPQAELNLPSEEPVVANSANGVPNDQQEIYALQTEQQTAPSQEISAPELTSPKKDDVELLENSPTSVQNASQPMQDTSHKRAKLAIVIDDLGFSYEFAQRILQLDIPVTWTIIPEAGQSRRTAALAEAHGQPYLVHIPMQATIDSRGSKEYVIGVDTPEAKIRDYLADLQKKFPAAIGVSNHRGSRATSDIETMLRFMKFLAPTGWPFLDSRTIAKTIAPRAAREYDIPVVQNTTFIDGKPELASMKKNLDAAIRFAQQQGSAIAICHAREATLPFLKSLRENQFPQVTFVTVDQLWQEQKTSTAK